VLFVAVLLIFVVTAKSCSCSVSELGVLLNSLISLATSTDLLYYYYYYCALGSKDRFFWGYDYYYYYYYCCSVCGVFCSALTLLVG